MTTYEQIKDMAEDCLPVKAALSIEVNYGREQALLEALRIAMYNLKRFTDDYNDKVGLRLF